MKSSSLIEVTTSSSSPLIVVVSSIVRHAWSSSLIAVEVVVIVGWALPAIAAIAAVVAGVGATVETTEGVVDAVGIRLAHAPAVGLLASTRLNRGQGSHSRTRTAGTDSWLALRLWLLLRPTWSPVVVVVRWSALETVVVGWRRLEILIVIVGNLILEVVRRIVVGWVGRRWIVVIRTTTTSSTSASASISSSRSTSI